MVLVTRVNNKSFIMTKRGRLLFVFLLLLCTTQLFADKKKAVEPTLEGEAKYSLIMLSWRGCVVRF